MIVIIGAMGFIGSSLAHWFNARGITNLLLVDDFKRNNWEYLQGLHFTDLMEIEDFAQGRGGYNPKAVINLGGHADTTCYDFSKQHCRNYKLAQDLWRWCVTHDAVYFYASSAATYGATRPVFQPIDEPSHGFSDSHANIGKLSPRSPYALSKHFMDMWALSQPSGGKSPKNWIGMKFFNVYGVNEGHKGGIETGNDTRSIIQQMWTAWCYKGRDKHDVPTRHYRTLKLFTPRLYSDDKDAIKRDFISVDDVCEVISFLLFRALDHPVEFMPMMDWTTEKYKVPLESGIYNIGTGKARSLPEMGLHVLKALGYTKQEIEDGLDPNNAKYDIEMGKPHPFYKTEQLLSEMEKGFQCYSCADISKLKAAGWSTPFTAYHLALRRVINQLEGKNEQ